MLLMLLEYSCLQNNGQKTKFSCKSPKTPAMEATSSERVISPELFGSTTRHIILTETAGTSFFLSKVER